MTTLNFTAAKILTLGSSETSWKKPDHSECFFNIGHDIFNSESGKESGSSPPPTLGAKLTNSQKNVETKVTSSPSPFKAMVSRQVNS